MKRSIVVFLIAGVALSLGAYLLPGRVHAADQPKINGFNIVVPESSIPRPGRIHTNYFYEPLFRGAGGEPSPLLMRDIIRLQSRTWTRFRATFTYRKPTSM